MHLDLLERTNDECAQGLLAARHDDVLYYCLYINGLTVQASSGQADQPAKAKGGRSLLELVSWYCYW